MTMKRKLIVFLSGLIVFGYLFVPSILPQTSADLSGIVKDPSGGVVPGATVILKSTTTGVAKTVMTNEAGAYQLPFIQPGTYSIEVSLAGFKTVNQTGLVLSAAQNARIDFVLQLGSVTETVTITAAAAAINTASAELGSVVDNSKVVELPLNGRLFWELPLIVPGVTPPVQNSSNSKRGGLNVAGSDESSNNFTLNGLDNNDTAVNAPLFRPSIDAIAETSVITGVYSAQYGFLSGGQIVVTTKSGGNKFHGSLFEFNRNSAVLAARNFFQASSGIPYFNRNQFGGTIGGPIIRDKSFFFYSYEGLRVREHPILISTIPTPAMVKGDFSGLLPKTVIRDPVTGQPFTGNIIPTNRISPIGTAILSYYPAPTSATPVGSAPRNNFVYEPMRPETWNTHIFRLDHTISDRDSMYFSFNYFHQTATEPIGVRGCNAASPFPGFACALDLTSKLFGFAETHMFSPTVLNEFRMAYSMELQPYATEAVGIDFWGPFGLNPVKDSGVLPKNGIPRFSMTGYTALTAGAQDRKDPRWQFTDDLSWTRGRHTFKFGFNYSHIGAMYVSSSAWGNLSFTNTSAGPTTGYAVSDVLLGLPTNTSVSPWVVGNDTRSISAAAYVQDDLKVNSRLTLNLGLRWEISTPLKDLNKRLKNFDPVKGIPLWQGNGLEDYAYEFDWKNYAPRLGFAWQPFGDGNTVIRGGIGTFYSRLSAVNNSRAILQGYPYSRDFSYTSSMAQPLLLSNPFPESGALIKDSLAGGEYHFQAPRKYGWSLSIQRQLSNTIMFDIAYMGSASRHLQTSSNINQPLPGPGSPAEVEARRPYLGWGDISFLRQDGNSSYHSMQSKFNKSLSKGISFMVSYTWANTIDDTNGLTNQYDRRTGRGPSSFDIRHRFVLSSVWELPFGKGRPFVNNGFMSYIAGGWQLSPMFQWQTGPALTSTLSGNFSNTGGGSSDRPNLIGNPNEDAPQTVDAWFNTKAFEVPIASGKPGALYGFGNAGVGIIRGPSYSNVDFSLVRSFQPNESIKIQFRMEIFNALNHTNLNPPATVANTSTFGVISAARDPRLSQLAIRIQF